jgi:hypothetical protein
MIAAFACSLRCCFSSFLRAMEGSSGQTMFFHRTALRFLRSSRRQRRSLAKVREGKRDAPIVEHERNHLPHRINRIERHIERPSARPNLDPCRSRERFDLRLEFGGFTLRFESLEVLRDNREEWSVKEGRRNEEGGGNEPGCASDREP